jgi:hypothetical protein
MRVAWPAAALLVLSVTPSLAGVVEREAAPEPGITTLAPGRPAAISLTARAFTIAGPLEAMTACCPPERIRIVDRAAPARALQVEAVGTDQQVTGFRGWRDPRPLTERRVHVLLAEPLQPDRDYELSFAGAAEPVSLTLRFLPDAPSRAIQVNQVGFHPQQRKQAFVGGWLGTAGALPIGPAAFDVLDDGGHSALRGTLTLRAEADEWSGNDVWEADFSALEQPGRYRIRVEGVGMSDSFQIGAGLYAPAAATVLRVLYHARNSTAIAAPWAAPGHERPAGIRPELDGVYALGVGDTPLGRGERPGLRHTTRRGWFDAGDYGQYVPNAAPVWFAIALGMDLDPAAFPDGALRIPESGNAIPDVLDELEWGFDWAVSMQDGEDGGVHFRIASQRWDDGLPASVTRPRLVAEKTTHATASFAALAAIHARLLAGHRPERAAAARTAAELAWDFLESHEAWPAEGERYRNRAGISAGEYADSSSLDNRLWAAAELFRLTRDPRYLRWYETHVDAVRLDPTGEVSYSNQAMAALWAYLRTEDTRRDAAQVEHARRAIVAGADWRIRQMVSNPFRAPVHPDRGLVGWGSFGHSARAVLSLAAAYALTGREEYREWAWQAPSAELGGNPLGLCLVTGLGARSPRYPLSKLSQFSADGTALPGLPMYGPHANLPATWPTTRAVNAGYWPSATREGGYPVLRRYTDARHLPPMNEPTVAEVARLGVALALLRDGGPIAPAPAVQQ